jgi:tRNA (guanine-N7-)-methyltransferase
MKASSSGTAGMPPVRASTVAVVTVAIAAVTAISSACGLSHAPVRSKTARVTDPYAHAPRLPESGPIDPRELVASGGRAVELELGPGRGWFIIERLEAEPMATMIGLEIRRKWATIVDQRLEQRGLGARARVFAEDARLVLPRFVPESVAVVYAHFPDPWWKKRHQKRLLVTRELAQEVARVLAPGGELFVQTDVAERAEAYVRVIELEPRLEPYPGGPVVLDNPYGAMSPRERRALADGLPVTRLRWRRCP